jgi:hypothetical protein
MESWSAEFVPFIPIEVSLAHNATQSANRNLEFFRHNDGIHGTALRANEFNVAALLAGFNKASGFKSTLDLSEG